MVKIIIVQSPTSSQDAPPPLRLSLPPQTPPACSRQEQTGLSERQRSARTRGSHAGLAKLGLPWIVKLVLHRHCILQQIELIQECKHALMQQQKCTGALRTHTRTHTHAQAHTRTDTHAQAHTRAHTQHTQT